MYNKRIYIHTHRCFALSLYSVYVIPHIFFEWINKASLWAFCLNVIWEQNVSFYILDMLFQCLCSVNSNLRALLMDENRFVPITWAEMWMNRGGGSLLTCHCAYSLYLAIYIYITVNSLLPVFLNLFSIIVPYPLVFLGCFPLNAPNEILLPQKCRIFVYVLNVYLCFIKKNTVSLFAP